MTAFLLDGKQVALTIRNELKENVSARIRKGYRPPGLAVILIGDDPASIIYVNNKRKACAEAGLSSFAYDLPASTKEDDLLSLIDELNHTQEIDGILVQLPLPEHINTVKVIERIDPAKDVDGFHPYNLGRLAQGNPLLRPCTPYGIMQLLKHYQLNPAGKHSVVIGASNIVGRPMALELLLAKATVTVCHRFTSHLESHVRHADLVVVATGRADVINTEWLHDQQILIDVGIHRLADGTLRGDVDFNKAKEKTAWITPVPGGVGPMTISTLLTNTLYAQKLGEN
ncbi:MULTISPECIES: bifunctional methylenetetrahydrofolate dehydrogenase/methenyltetrahydrofolate cyclohydrolase FolD [Legionella]|uniref:Bifunctional protein FolD n=1 Tax=Legionella septentrionalis TaxID=2498109 RepID=A0A433JH60_9GAMM|nr:MULTISPECIES: bifunctional methylenetetrahydrofolate dehydrogenase/methenyltetrahydrofolate cyclohydrolase FolD [Legionella]MCP0913631.1 bifunctional methylenetetrahydrofolate dehydrogenase/methenyltetrahydrofolate cyclohydrolase FolD [Legionella sp. 27cVA30]RUQ81638.1 bifunctional methylenetetrahydrofolate dehydrogenase/methenyltetrahydrofolate cyclohydrolase FolD [Legionella septentrionalis]RUQ96341.1 bifunctional methylenetetrahydrofolate dehydrogenase/methenyltetrahydrofolate cyclohydrola